MTAGELAVLMAAVLCSIGFAALVVVLMRVLDALRELRREVSDLRSETRPLLNELRLTTVEARETVDEARSDLERFDRVLGSAEAIGDAVGVHVAKTAYSTPMIKFAGLAQRARRARSPVSAAARRAVRSGPEIRWYRTAPTRVLDIGEEKPIEIGSIPERRAHDNEGDDEHDEASHVVRRRRRSRCRWCRAMPPRR